MKGLYQQRAYTKVTFYNRNFSALPGKHVSTKHWLSSFWVLSSFRLRPQTCSPFSFAQLKLMVYKLQLPGHQETFVCFWEFSVYEIKFIFLLLIFFLINFCWSVAALQSCMTFAVHQSESVTSVHIFPLCLQRALTRVPWAVQLSLMLSR